MPEAVAYIRRSVSRANDAGDLSREFQAAEVRKLANGDAPRIIDADWGRSAATDKTNRRLAFLALMDAVERGEVSTLYAYSADRLARSVEWSSRLWNACARTNTVIVTTTRRFEPHSADDAGWSIWHYEAMANEQALRSMVAKARATTAARMRRGDYMGQVPYGWRRVKVGGAIRLERDPDKPVDRILDVVRETGGRIRTAVQILNEREKIPSAYGRKWDRPALVRLVQREAPELRPIRAPSGRREAAATPAALAKLLRCHCGATLTPNRHVERRRARETVSVSYYCHRGNADRSDHPRVYVSEAKLLPVIQIEASRFPGDLAGKPAQIADQGATRVALLNERRRRLVRGYADGGYTDDEYEREIAAIAREVDALSDRGRVVDIPAGIDWSWEPKEINNVLRVFWERVELGPDLTPVKFVWRIPPEYLA